MNNLEILNTVYTTEDAYIYNKIINNEFINAYLIIEPFITNAGVITESYFCNDFPIDMADDAIIFDVENLTNTSNLKQTIEG